MQISNSFKNIFFYTTSKLFKKSHPEDETSSVHLLKTLE